MVGVSWLGQSVSIQSSQDDRSENVPCNEST